MKPARLAPIAALLLGVASVFGFAPFGLSMLPALTLAGLFALWQQARSARAAAGIGFAFGAGLFGAGVSWVFIALHTFGEMPAVLAAIGTAGFCAVLAVYPALAGWLSARWTRPSSPPRLIAAAAAWTLCEWLRSWLLSGFGWLSVGYAQVGQPLAGYAPVGGVLLTGFGLAFSAALLVAIVQAAEAHRGARVAVLIAIAACVWLGGYGLSTLEWSRPSSAPITISLVQGNIDQEVKFDPENREKTLAAYADLVAKARGRLIVLPESALPMFADEVPADYVARLRTVVSGRGGDLLSGLFFFEPRERADEEDRYFNSVVSIGSSMTQVYRKHHLVPFGETIPAKPVVGWFIRNVLSIPLADQTPGPAYQEPFAVAGERLAVNICYEDCVWRRAGAASSGRNTSGQCHQRRVVRQVDRGRAARAGRRHASGGDVTADGARHQHGHHLDRRSSRERAGTLALVHSGHSRRNDLGPNGHHALRALWRRAARRAGAACLPSRGAGREEIRQACNRAVSGLFGKRRIQ